MRRRGESVPILFWAVLFACSESPFGPVVERIDVDTATLGVVVGDSIRLEWTARDPAGNPVAGRSATISIADPAIASVTDGWLKGLAPGQTRVSIAVDNVVGTVDVAVNAGFTAVSAGFHYACGLRSNGTTYCWGAFYPWGAELLSSAYPRKTDSAFFFDSVSVGWMNQCGLAAWGGAYCWGIGYDTQTAASPVAVSGGHLFRQIDVGFSRSCGVTRAGALYCWDDLGEFAPTLIDASREYDRVAAAQNGGCAIDIDAHLWCWGHYLTGRDDDQMSEIRPDLRFGHVTVGGPDVDLHACAITTGQVTLCWGRTPDGSLGDGSGLEEQLSPVVVAGGHLFVQVDTFTWMTCGLTLEGQVFCWGRLPLGTEPVTRSDVPVAMSPELRFRTIEVGQDFYCGITAPGHAYCEGNSQSLGNGGTGGSGVAIRVPDPIYGGPGLP